eukprot:m.66570 g.66570  ORF g.66570 m.66570 type:complete len:288 (+) comp12123_c0_seq1:144-1007(+)
MWHPHTISTTRSHCCDCSLLVLCFAAVFLGIFTHLDDPMMFFNMEKEVPEEAFVSAESLNISLDQAASIKRQATHRITLNVSTKSVVTLYLDTNKADVHLRLALPDGTDYSKKEEVSSALRIVVRKYFLEPGQHVLEMENHSRWASRVIRYCLTEDEGWPAPTLARELEEWWIQTHLSEGELAEFHREQQAATPGVESDAIAIAAAPAGGKSTQHVSSTGAATYAADSDDDSDDDEFVDCLGESSYQPSLQLAGQERRVTAQRKRASHPAIDIQALLSSPKEDTTSI